MTGAGGYIGRRVVSQLLDDGFLVRALVHRWSPLEMTPSLEIVRADIRDADAVARAVRGVDAIVHLAAAKADEPESEAINVGGARNLIESCRSSGCRRVINVSTQSTKIVRKGLYGRTKLAADELLQASPLDVTTLLLSLVYDESPEGVFGTLQRVVERLPVVPVLGDGTWISAPVHAADVCAAISACLRHESTIGRTYDVAGPHRLTFDEIIDIVGRRVGRTPRVVHIPFGLSLLIARLLAGVHPRPPVTISNVLGSNQDTSIDITPASTDFGFTPRDFSAAMAQAGAVPRVSIDAQAREARLLANYLLGTDPAPELAARYQAACAKLFGDDADAELLFVRRHAWALPLLDAAAGLIRPESRLRQRVRLMAAILETTPRYASFFLEEPGGRFTLVANLAAQALRSAGAAALGIPLLLFIRAAHPWPTPTSS